MLGIIVLALFAVVETAFLVGLAFPKTQVHRWTNPIGVIGVPVLIYGLYAAFNSHGINGTAVAVLLLSLAILVVSTVFQMKSVETMNTLALAGQIISVSLLIPSFWFAIRNLDNVEIWTKIITTGGFLVYEVLTIIYLAIQPANIVPPEKARAKVKAGVMILLIMSVCVFGFGLGSMLEAVGAF